MNRRNYSKELDSIVEEQRREGRTPTLLLQCCCAPCSSACLERLREDFKVTVFYYNPNITIDAEYEKRKAEEKRLIGIYNRQVETQDFSFPMEDGEAGSGAESIGSDDNGGCSAEKAGSGIPGICSDREQSESRTGVSAEVHAAGMHSTARAQKIDILDCDHDAARYLEAVKGLEGCPEGGERCTVCFRLRLRETARVAAEKGFEYCSTTLTISPMKDVVRLNAIGEEAAKEFGVKWLPSEFRKKNGYLRSIQLSHEFGLYRQNYCGCVFSRM